MSDPLDETVDIWQAFWRLEYAFSREWSVSGTFTYRDIEQRIRAAGMRNRVSGIGDTLVLVHWNVVRAVPDEGVEGESVWLHEPRLRLRLDLGSTIPSGEPEVPRMGMTGTPSSVLQTGTGTFDPALGAHLHVDWGGVVATLDAAAVLPVYENRYDFQSGDFERVSVGVEVLPVEGLRVRVGVDVEHRSRDLVRGRRVSVGGGWRMSVHPEVSWSPAAGVNLFLGTSIPFYRSFDTRLLDSAVTWEAGVHFTF